MRGVGAFRCLILLYCVLPSLAWPQSTPNFLVLTNANVIDTRTGSVGHNLTVVIRDGTIRSIAKIGLIQASRKLRVVNANGKYLIPGLWDMQVRSANGPAAAWDEKILYPLYIANGVTGVRDMEGDADLLDQRQQRIQNGEFLGPNVVFPGGALDSTSSDGHVIAVNNPAEARHAVHTFKDRGVDLIKLLPHVARETYLAIADEAARVRLHFVGQVPESVSVAEASAAGQRSIEHLSGVLLACSSQEAELRRKTLEALTRDDAESYAALTDQTIASYDPQKAWNLFSELTDHNTYQVPALVSWWAAATLDAPGVATDPRLQYVPVSIRTQWAPAKVRQHTTPGQLAGSKALSSRYIELVHSMHRAGVPFMTGTNGPDSYVFPGFSLHDELELLVKAGFSNAEALSAATFYPALFMVKLDKYGVIEPGRVADMVLLDANPLEDIRNTRKISAVVVRGKYHSRLELDRTLAQVAEAAGKQDVAARTP